MFRILIPAALVIGISLISRPASAQPLSLVSSLPVVAALLGLAVLGAALYLPRREARAAQQPSPQAEWVARLKHPQPTSAADKTEVVLVFSYDDALSYRLEPMLARWEREFTETTHLVRLPATTTAGQAFYARVYYAACTLGIAERLHGSIFDAIHLGGNPLDDEDRVTRFVADHGVDPAAFRKALHASAVQTALHKAELLNRGYEIESVPALIVDGTLKITLPEAGSLPRLLETLDRLVAQQGAAST